MLNSNIGFDKTLRVAVKNTTGVQIAANKVVAISGYDATNDLLLIQLADSSTGKPAIGITDAAIDNGAVGTAIKFGLYPTNTTGKAVGDLIYLSTAGNFTYTLPSALSIRQELGRVASVGASGWVYMFIKPYVPISMGVPSLTTAFFDSATPYLETALSALQVVCQLPFIGTSVWYPTTFVVVASFSGAGSTGEIRLYDATNAQEMALVTANVEAVTIYQDITLTNLPANTSIMEVQYRVATGNKKIRIHSIALY